MHHLYYHPKSEKKQNITRIEKALDAYPGARFPPSRALTGLPFKQAVTEQVDSY